MSELSALILAGGLSSRMGKDKALSLWQGIPLLQQVCTVAANCCPTIYVITPWPDRYKTLVSNVCWIHEDQPGQGPLVALTQGLMHIPTDWVLLLACDLPCLQATVLQQWAMQLATLPAETLAFAPYHHDRWEPLCAFYRRRAQLSLQAFVQQGGRSFQRWLAQNPVQSIPVEAEMAAMLRNCNTPADLAE
ncbi:MAG: molybdenum cofactor guanylyltransferase [Cyanobacteria bacterium]|nr:molybdenum cofactor guanylyltransferase [Cyanobacteriota bacterium]MDW8203179.1 molybdenum cofactor guanylyltransferase [Cyanobacteriota bacterium SKYGB_h_bin112]